MLKLIVNNPKRVSPDDPADAEGYGGWRLNDESKGELCHTVGATRVASKAPLDSMPDYNALTHDMMRRLAPYPGSRFGMTHGGNGDTTIIVRVLPTMPRSVFKKKVVRMFTSCLKKHDVIRKPIIEELPLLVAK